MTSCDHQFSDTPFCEKCGSTGEFIDSAEWDGCLPLRVGDRLEYLTTEAGEYWCKAEVKYSGIHMAVIGYSHPKRGAQEAVFNCALMGEDLYLRIRKISEASRISARIRSKACDEMFGIMSSPLVREGNRSDMAEALYDAGYRKFEIVEN